MKVQLNDVINEIYEYGNYVISDMAQYTKNELVKETQNSIVAFYRHYTPLVYERHQEDPMKSNVMRHSFRPYYKNSHKRIAHGGIQLTFDFMEDLDSYRISPDIVAESIYIGSHGPNWVGNHTPIMVPPPILRIEEKRDTIIKDSKKIGEKAKEKAKQHKYKYIHF